MTLLWTISVIGFILLEAATTQFVCIWFAGGAFAALIFSMFGTALWLQCLIFVIVSAILLIFTKKLVNRLKSKSGFKNNIESLIGQSAAVIEPISNIDETGTVKLRGVIWSARCKNGEEIPKGTIVTVQKIDGVKLIVNKKEEA